MKRACILSLLLVAVNIISGCCQSSYCNTCGTGNGCGLTAFNSMAYSPQPGGVRVGNAFPSTMIAQNTSPYTAGPAVPGLMNVSQQQPLNQVASAGPSAESAPLLAARPQSISQLGYAAPGSHPFRRRHMNVCVRPGSPADRLRRRSAGTPELPQNRGLADGLAPTPAQDLRYRGGKTIRDLKFVNIYVGGNAAWDPEDRRSIDWALGAAMSDENLNNVMLQYFNDEPISSELVHSFFLEGGAPASVSQAEIENTLQSLYSQGSLSQFDLQNTVFNFLMPRGTVLTDAQNTSYSPAAATQADRDGDEPKSPIPHEEEASSLAGLGGYHGSVHAGNDTIYFAAGAYSEVRPDGSKNGIPAFDQPWKSIVATFYHEMQEVRTDPDVEDATRAGDDPNASRFLGWTSDSGEECGDFPIDEAAPLSLVFREVPLADGSGTVPVQLQYSNAVHGPEGPVSTPRAGSPARSRRRPRRPQDAFGLEGR